MGAVLSAASEKRAKEEAEKASGELEKKKAEAKIKATSNFAKERISKVEGSAAPGNVIGNTKAKKETNKKTEEIDMWSTADQLMNAMVKQARPRTVTPQQAMDKMRERGNTMVQQKQGYEKMREIFSKWKEDNK